MIGKLEELTLLACIRAGENALPSAIYARVLAGQRSAAFGAIYTTLDRLAKKEFLSESTVVDASGRERRAFTISGKGRLALSEALRASAAVGQFDPMGGLDVVGV